MRFLYLLFFIGFFLTLQGNSQDTTHTFTLARDQFLLDGKPFRIIAGELHPARIPAEYWRHRIQMAKAMGVNTIASYIFWNYHEIKKGVFDFQTENHNIRQFIKICQEEGMWVLLRPGPYVCAEWDLGGIPSYLLGIPDITLRCKDDRYMNGVERYFRALSAEVADLQITKGGPILMVQIENEYGSYGNDMRYLEKLREMWIRNGIEVPFYTADGPTEYMLEAGNLDGCAIGLDPGANAADFEQAYKHNPNVPSFCSELYPGWLTHWREDWARPDTADLLKDVKWLMDNNKSFNFYVIHGGTNFGFWAGANAPDRDSYQPDITSYDYDAPINEAGQATKKYHALRKLMASYLPAGQMLPVIPDEISLIEIPEIPLDPLTTVWENLPQPLEMVQPKPMEILGQGSGFILYRTTLSGHKKGKLKVTDLHDYATVFIDGKYVGTLDRSTNNHIIDLPAGDSANPVLDILVEAMGRINYGQFIIDRKGITERVTLNGMTLMNWKVYNLPMEVPYLSMLKSSIPDIKPGMFFSGSFSLEKKGDTFLDLSKFTKGVVWVNGHNLGRYWNVGPQQRLYCPAPWLNEGENSILVFDLHQTEGAKVEGYRSMEGK